MLYLAFEIFRWIFVSAAIGVPLIGGLYILVTPTFKLVESWQNYRLSRTQRPLKDEHFRGLPRRIKFCKALSFVVVLCALYALIALVNSLIDKHQH